MAENITEKKEAPTPPVDVKDGAEVAAEVATEEKKEEGAPAAEEKSPKEIIFERIRASRPEAKYDEDENEYFRQIGSVLDDLEGKTATSQKFMDDMAKWFNEEPEEAMAVLDRVKEGVPLIAGLRRYKGDEAFTMQEGDEGWDAWQQAEAGRKADRERIQKYADEIKSNTEASDAAFEEFAKELELDDEQKQKMWDMIHGDLEDLLHGKISKDLLGRYRNALNHDDDVNAAHEQGKVEGRGEKIDAQHKRMQGSGLPGAEAGGDIEPTPVEDKRSETAKFLSGIKRR